MLEVPTGRLFVALLVLLALGTAAAVIVLWPDGEGRPTLSPSLRLPTA